MSEIDTQIPPISAWSDTLDDMPRVPDQMLHGVAFLYRTLDEARQNKRVGGTAFLVSRPAPRATKELGQLASIPFLVSNRHVVWNGGCPVARFNRRDGSAKIIEFGPEHWVAHPEGDDVAVACPFRGLDRREDQISTASIENLLAPEVAEEADIGVGDDVYMIGRFINHQGRDKISPAVRFGNISMTPEVIWNSDLQRDQLSYAVEMRSRTGFSGSPVIVYRQPGTALTFLPEGKESGWAVLGINWGYILDETGENTWLNGVVPAWKILDVLVKTEMQALFEEFDKAAAGLSKPGAAKSSVATEDIVPPTTDENPQHREDFNRLLGEAVSRSKRDRGT